MSAVRVEENADATGLKATTTVVEGSPASRSPSLFESMNEVTVTFTADETDDRDEPDDTAAGE
jgi:hypothetical protein